MHYKFASTIAQIAQSRESHPYRSSTAQESMKGSLLHSDIKAVGGMCCFLSSTLAAKSPSLSPCDLFAVMVRRLEAGYDG